MIKCIHIAVSTSKRVFQPFGEHQYAIIKHCLNRNTEYEYMYIYAN